MTGSGSTARPQNLEGSRAVERKDEARKIKLNGVTFSTYNVRTLYQTGKFDQLIHEASKINETDFIGIQEHRWITQEQVSQHWSEDREFLFVYSSALPDRVGGVGLLIRKKHVPAFRYAERVSERILKVYFEGNPKITIVVAYAPTEMRPADEKDLFYDDIQATINSEPSHSLVAVLGDFNARVGDDSHQQQSQVVGRYLYHQETNDNGKRLVDLCLAAQLRVAQTRFPQPRKKLWTWRHPSGSLAQLDHILISAKWIRSVTNCRAFNTLEIDSDHQVPKCPSPNPFPCTTKTEM